jgi:hypothetical protein
VKLVSKGMVTCFTVSFSKIRTSHLPGGSVFSPTNPTICSDKYKVLAGYIDVTVLGACWAGNKDENKKVLADGYGVGIP